MIEILCDAAKASFKGKWIALIAFTRRKRHNQWCKYTNIEVFKKTQKPTLKNRQKGINKK